MKNVVHLKKPEDSLKKLKINNLMILCYIHC